MLLGQFHQLGVQLGRYTGLDPLEEVEKNASALPSPAWKTDSTKFSVVLKLGSRSRLLRLQNGFRSLETEKPT
ncbi:hypothetical protein BH600_04275 [Pseudomonas aeruginosa]|nr:hypothetical protein A6R75_32575 [Pseudomonas aeruginosa]ETD49685.1 hypothetical protein X778_20485 [Pseudomonas aeruginosa VRFPA07]OFQ75792.1 hypothetical protein HMPREF2924_20100 [Pseudomonas sp. HMSC063H08]OFQ91951.1 hypothetical protein HMPREF2914_04785 [Pseudomonas sp. HMSC067G02]APB66737.1 hypothetical protein BMR72_20895 [Pseudomonas aeruginosa]